MKLKIVSDGTSFNTHVVNAETGEELQYVKSIRWEVCGKSRRASAVVELANVELDADTHAEICRPVSAWGLPAWRAGLPAWRAGLAAWLPWRRR